ncbi:LysR family transcriptional regulator [Rhizobium sp. KVB221]|uniref:HTH-type transcriptional regulator TtuA n=1 Tax=Rhizobium setariae TaxID=2801340 RepID=A0A937CM42_9HYPH|nr:LysR substrate-binding domain-containing protein [Rhizobium setariae]MBL0370509.1 LysR family transcriptional regulator [Rhizobium setariae]
MSSTLESDLLRTFVAVADTRNFTKAGEVVGRTQSAVSIQMKRLEENLGESLFDRTSRGVILTTHGNHLLSKARRVIAMLEEAAASVRQPHLSGLVRIGIPEEYSSFVLPRALGSFDSMHPGVEILVRFGLSATNIQALNNDLLDLAVVYEQGDHSAHELLCSDPTVWVTSKIHEQHLRSPMPVAMYTSESWCKTMSLASLDRKQDNYRISYLSDSSNGLTAGVRAGLGIAPLARTSIPDDCRELTAADGFQVIDFSRVVLRLSNRLASEAILGMADAIRQAFRASQA